MLIALNEKNEYIHASTADGGDGEFACPGCREPVFIKKGSMKIPHFSHYKHAACNVFSEVETAEHMKGKLLLYEWLKHSDIPVQMEAYLPKLKQRPDLLCWLENGTALALEFQCSHLTPERMLERTKGYKNEGYHVCWIMGKNFFLRSRFTSFQRLFLTEIQNQQIVYLELDVDREEINITHSFSVNAAVNQMRYNRKKIALSQPLTNETSNALLDIPAGKKQMKIGRNVLFSLQKKLNQKRWHKDSETVKLLQEMYIEGDHLISLPLETYLPVEWEWLTESNSFRWKYAVVKWIEKRGVGAVIHAEDIEKLASKLQKDQLLVFNKSGLINEETYQLPVFEFIHLLARRHILLPISFDQWIVYATPVHFKTEEEKQRAFAAHTL